MTKAQCKQIMGLLDAIGVPDSAEIKVGSDSLVSSEFNLSGEPIHYYLDSNDSWANNAGNPANATAVILVKA